ncbi:MAG: hypothetical protein ACNYPD_05310 [Candidatus Halichondribacter symbioticus]
MPYIKLLTVLAGLALLTACGGGTAETPANNNGEEMPDNDKTDEMPDNDKTGGGNATDCTQTPFHNDCLMNNAPALLLRQTMCFASATANPTCGAVIMGACEANPFRAETACMADTYLPNRIAECITDGNAGEAKCETLLSDTDMNTALTDCLTNPFDVACESVTAFTTYALARTNRASFCDNSDNVADDLCTGDVVMPICGLDPFNAICFTDDTYLSPRITDCIMAGNAGEEKCETLLSDTAMNTELTDCLENPFATACESVDGFTTFALARTNRLTFCNDNMNVANGLCTGANLMNVCVADPFNAICFTDATYLPARITNCIMAGNAGDMKCDTIVSDNTMNDAITNCLENPFATACESVSAFTTFALARTNRVTFCEIGGNESNALCMDTTLTNLCEFNPFSTACIGHPDTPDLQVASCSDVNNNNKDPSCTEVGLVKENDLPAYPALPATTRPTGFLEGGTEGISTTGFTTQTAGTNSLNFTATAGEGEAMVSLGGADTDGVAWAVVNLTNSSLGYYAGIFSDTNMGAPLVRPATATGAEVTWKGIIQSNGVLDGVFGSAIPFTLNVDLFNRTLETYIIINNIQAFTIDGNYDAKGLIGGTTLRGQYMTTADPDTLERAGRSMGTLTGLIGEKGAVAAFHSDGTAGGYSGGFLAKPTPPVVNNADWLASFGASPPPTTPATNTSRHGFLQGGTDTVDFGSIRKSNNANPDVRTLDLATATYDNTDDAVGNPIALGGDAEDGVAYFSGQSGGSTYYNYAGIFSGTNLGAPLPAYVAESEPIVVWNGKFGAQGSASIFPHKDFTLNVNLQTRKIDAFVQFGGIIHYKLDGDFNDEGVIVNGTVSYGNFTNSNPDLLIPAPGNKLGILTGLVGQEGAVGVFHSNNDGVGNTSYVGGFVACPLHADGKCENATR